jgi:hypothetical protein
MNIKRNNRTYFTFGFVYKIRIIAILLLVLKVKLAAVTNYIISDYDFTNINLYPQEKYVEVFGDRMSYDDVLYIVYWYRHCGINPLVGFVTYLKEGRAHDDFTFGYGIHLEDSDQYKLFEAQVRYSAHCLMRHYRQAQGNGMRTYIYTGRESGGYYTVANAATYALYRYTPLWCVDYGDDKHGNFVFARIWDKYKKFMESSDEH